jgi:hypothetical protein
MLMNPDKNIKVGLFNYYREDINERRMIKEENTNLEKRNDKVYMDQIKRSNQEEKLRMESQRLKRVNENLNEYGQFLSKKDEEMRNKFKKNTDIYHENYQKKGNSYSMGNLNQFEIFNSNISSNSPKNINPDMTLINESKVKKDSLNFILQPDYIPVRKLNEMEKNNKNEYQKFYRNILDSQMDYMINSPDQINNYKNVVNMISNPCKNYFIFYLLNIRFFKKICNTTF